MSRPGEPTMELPAWVLDRLLCEGDYTEAEVVEARRWLRAELAKRSPGAAYQQHAIEGVVSNGTNPDP